MEKTTYWFWLRDRRNGLWESRLSGPDPESLRLIPRNPKRHFPGVTVIRDGDWAVLPQDEHPFPLTEELEALIDAAAEVTASLYASAPKSERTGIKHLLDIRIKTKLAQKS